MTTAISGVTSTGAASSQTTGLGAMNAQDFLKVMLAQMQQQDPLNPSSSDQLLTQLSQIKSLQSNDTLTSTLQNFSLQQSMSSGANLIGKTVTGVADDGSNVTGNVTSVQMQNNQVLLNLDSGNQLALTSVIAIMPTVPTVPTVPVVPAATPPVTQVVTTPTTQPAAAG